jgi:hypothetical protein
LIQALAESDEFQSFRPIAELSWRLSDIKTLNGIEPESMGEDPGRFSESPLISLIGIMLPAGEPVILFEPQGYVSFSPALYVSTSSLWSDADLLAQALNVLNLAPDGIEKILGPNEFPASNYGHIKLRSTDLTFHLLGKATELRIYETTYKPGSTHDGRRPIVLTA